MPLLQETLHQRGRFILSEKRHRNIGHQVFLVNRILALVYGVRKCALRYINLTTNAGLVDTSFCAFGGCRPKSVAGIAIVLRMQWLPEHAGHSNGRA